MALPKKTIAGSSGSPGTTLDKLGRLALILAWIVLAGTVLLEVLNRLRIYLGYQPFDSQWGLIGIFSLFGFLLIIFLALFLFVACPIGLVLAQRQSNPVTGRRLLLALLINLVGFSLFIIL